MSRAPSITSAGIASLAALAAASLHAAAPASASTAPAAGTAQAATPAADAGAAGDWNLAELYASDAAWTAAFQRETTAVAALKSWQGKLAGGDAALFKALDAISAAHRESSRLHTYAGLRSDADLRAAAGRERVQQVQSLGTELDKNTAWLAPEILALGAQRVHAALAQNAELKRRFGFYLENTLRSAPHTLGSEAEGVLAAAGTVLQQPEALHSEFTNAELPLPTVTLHDGQSVQLSEAGYEKYRQVTDRADRKLVFDSFWASWQKFSGTLGAMLATQVMGNVFNV